MYAELQGITTCRNPDKKLDDNTLEIFKNSLIELSKVNAPALKLYEFNYYINKAVNMYINQIYNIYDVNQQTTDDLRVLQGSIYLTPTKLTKANQAVLGDAEQKASNYLSSKYSQLQSLYGAAYEAWLPMDYLHILNCICTFEVTLPYDCYDAGTFIQKPAKRLTSDAWPLVMDDIYNRPTHENPYYQIYNQNRNTVNTLPTDPVTAKTSAKGGEAATTGTDINGEYGVETYNADTLANGKTKGGNSKRTFTFSNGFTESLVERTAAQRIGNPSNVRIEIRYGRDDSLFKLREIQVDYIKVPQYLRLTQEQLDLTQDVSQMLEWPDYICQEITRILVSLLMERTNDPRLSNNIQISQSIARPNGQQQQATPAATQQA